MNGLPRSVRGTASVGDVVQGRGQKTQRSDVGSREGAEARVVRATTGAGVGVYRRELSAGRGECIDVNPPHLYGAVGGPD